MVIFFLARITVLAICIACGYQYNKTPSNKFWLVVPIVLISLNEGLRFGRGTDYNVYFFNYNDVINGYDIRSDDFLFIILCKLNDLIGLPYQGLVYMMSLILIVTGLVFLQNHKAIMAYAIPLFVLYTTDAENLMRWFTAFSFLLIGISYLERNKIREYFIFSVIAFLFHSGIIVVIPIFFAFHYIEKPILKPLVSCLIYLTIYFSFKTSFMLNFISYMNIFSGMGQFAGYVENADAWLTGTSNFESEGLTLMNVLMDLIIIRLGYKLQSTHSDLTYLYNISLLGTILSPALYQIEILYRIVLLFKLFQFIIIAYSIYYFISKAKVKGMDYIFTLLVVLNIFRVHIFNILIKPYDSNSYLYIWDSMGRNVLLF